MQSICTTCGQAGSMICAATSSHFAVPPHQLNAVLNPQLPTKALAELNPQPEPAAAQPLKTTRAKAALARRINDSLARGANQSH